MAQRRRILRTFLVFVVFVCAAYLGSLDIRFLFQLFPVALGVGLVLGLLIYAIRLKKVLVAAFSSSNRRPARPEEFVTLDMAELGQLTLQWEGLGFVQRGDFSGGAAPITNFVRLFEYEEAGAVAELTQQFLPAKTLPFGSSVTSLWGDTESRRRVQQLAEAVQQVADTTAPLASPTSASQTSRTLTADELQLPLWILVTHNHAPNRYFPLLRQERVLGERLARESSPAQVWQAHRERRELVTARLNKPLLRDELPELLQDAGCVISARIVQRLNSTPLWRLMPFRFARDSSAPSIHDGELAPLDGGT